MLPCVLRLPPTPAVHVVPRAAQPRPKPRVLRGLAAAAAAAAVQRGRRLGLTENGAVAFKTSGAACGWP